MGPICASRRPMVLRHTRSAVSASQTPSATRAMASRQSACCSLLPTKPGTSRSTRTASLPRCSSRATVRSITSVEVCSPRTTSTIGMRSGGFHQCVPTTRSGAVANSAMLVMGSTEVLVAMIARSVSSLIAAMSCCLAPRSSMMASVMKSLLATASGRLVLEVTVPGVDDSEAIWLATATAPSSNSALESCSTTSAPPRAMMPAIRRPMSPAPTTVARRTSPGRAGFSTRCTRRRGRAPDRSQTSRHR
ncbi:unannotated protein [freshwater metagenome]|uniref:Unannotated protein n=1 Tax=freshwater metagenome TaxID=449393 RepID=A0A6J7LE34_9ZZZZ